jgi:Flp pilus assembly pilin Flp
MQPTQKQVVKQVRRTRARSGQSLVEYAIVLAFIAMIVVLALRGIGQTTNNMLLPVNNGFNQQ